MTWCQNGGVDHTAPLDAAVAATVVHAMLTQLPDSLSSAHHARDDLADLIAVLIDRAMLTGSS